MISPGRRCCNGERHEPRQRSASISYPSDKRVEGPSFPWSLEQNGPLYVIARSPATQQSQAVACGDCFAPLALTWKRRRRIVIVLEPPWISPLCKACGRRTIIPDSDGVRRAEWAGRDAEFCVATVRSRAELKGACV